MAKKLSPGQSQLGHPAMSKVNMEGPKKHHDFHGNSASVPGKGNGMAVPGEHWEKQYQPRAAKDMDKVAGTEWNPRLSKDRTKTYVPVNEEDH